tara:strand:- start:48290 stop:48844 length:555 start_codon:yes stop_codon:yes gene_type:complete
MDQGYEKEQFETLKIKTSVALKFRKYCRTLRQSQSMTLGQMVDFFHANGVSPKDHLGMTIASLKEQLIKRTNAIIAIIKSIERLHNQPTTALLQSLFEVTAKIEKEEEEQVAFEPPKLITENEELAYYKKAYHTTQEAQLQLQRDTEVLLKKLTYVRNSFGVGHYRLHMTKEEVTQFKEKLSHV